MKKNRYSKTNIFFLELIIVIFFFAMASTLLLSVFVKANRLRLASKNQTHAMIAVQCVAEKIKGRGELEIGLFPLYYDAEWQSVDNKEDGVFVMNVESQKVQTISGELLDVDLVASKLGKEDEEAIWQMSFKDYIPRNVGK